MKTKETPHLNISRFRHFSELVSYFILGLMFLIILHFLVLIEIYSIKVSFEHLYFNFKWTKKIPFDVKRDAYYYKNYIHYPKYNSSYTQIISKNSTISGFFYHSAVAREYVRFIHMKQAYCTSAKAIAKNGIVFKFRTMRFGQQMPTKEAYDNIVFLFSPWGNVFAHWLQDCLPALFFIPEDIINKSKIMVPFKNYKSWLDLFNINESQVIYDTHNFYYAENLYFYNSVDSINGLCIYSFVKLVDFLRDKFELSSIKATRYVFSNKKKHEKRSISNLCEFLTRAQEEFPQYKWEWDEWDFLNLKGNAQNIATIKILVSPSGSKLYNTIYMNMNLTTGVCILNSKKYDSPNYALGLNFGIWQIGFTHRVGHESKWWKCNIQYGLVCLRRLLYAVENGKWPDDTFDDMREVFDLKKLFKESYSNLERPIPMFK